MSEGHRASQETVPEHGTLLSAVWGTASACPYLLLSAGQHKKEFLEGRHIAGDFLREEKWQLETIV